jgi:Uma2 family endonuclease
MAIEHTHWITIEEYHRIEQQNSEVKYEYSDGRVYAMAGGTYNHSSISLNLGSVLKAHLRGKVCRVVNSDMHVLPRGDENPSYLPDITVTCNPDDYQGESTAVRSPRLIIEILSPSTAYRDRGEKLRTYKACSSMQEYALVSTRRREVEVYRRESAHEWTNTLYTAEETVRFVSIELSIPMSEIYADTDTPPLDSWLDAD